MAEQTEKMTLEKAVNELKSEISKGVSQHTAKIAEAAEALEDVINTKIESKKLLSEKELEKLKDELVDLKNTVGQARLAAGGMSQFGFERITMAMERSLRLVRAHAELEEQYTKKTLYMAAGAAAVAGVAAGVGGYYYGRRSGIRMVAEHMVHESNGSKGR